MITLERQHVGRTSRPGQVVLVFGLGLIGRSITQELHKQGAYSTTEHPFPWTGDAAVQLADGQRIVEFLSSRTRSSSGSRDFGRVDTVWSAGKGGFGSTQEQLAPELRSFEHVLRLSSQLRERYPGAEHVFHMVSSAGGLFEGQCQVGPESRPEPRRPYGDLKLRQERLLAGFDPAIRRFVYRPSSVYGFVAGTRQGLVTTLMNQSIHRGVAHIFGEPGTLRDYVLVDDVGRFVAGRLTERMGDSCTYTLASGKPSTIAEVLRIVEALFDRSLYVVFQRSTFNAEHNTYRPEALPAGWTPADLYTGMLQTKLRVYEFFARGSAR